jgi:hypothetical protein
LSRKRTSERKSRRRIQVVVGNLKTGRLVLQLNGEWTEMEE